MLDPPSLVLSGWEGLAVVDVHSGQFRRSAAGDLLHAQLAQLRLQAVELLRQVIFALAPELAGLDFCVGRLR